MWNFDFRRGTAAGARGLIFLFPLNLGDLKSHDHETWHVGPLSDVDVHGLSGILIFGRVVPQAARGLIFLFSLNLGDLKSHDHETWHVGPLNDEELHRMIGIFIFGRVAPQAHAA